MISGIKIINKRWNYEYPKKDTYKVHVIENEKKANNNLQNRKELIKKYESIDIII